MCYYTIAVLTIYRISCPQVDKHQLPNVHVLKAVQHAYPTLTETLIENFDKGLTEHMKRGATAKRN